MLNTLDEKVQKAPRDFVRVYDIINNSKEKYVTKTKILNQLGYDVNKANDRWLTQVITSLIINYQYPVGYSYKKDARGYFIIKNEDDKKQAICSVKRQMLGTQPRLDVLQKLSV